MNKTARTKKPRWGNRQTSLRPLFSMPSRCFPRVLPPAGGFSSPLSIFSILLRLRQASSEYSLSESAAHSLRRELEQIGISGDNRCLSLCGSGKEALYQVFSGLGTKKLVGVVGVGGYTCPDIAAAVVKSGAKILPLDMNPATLELENNRAENFDVLVFSNLYGLPDSLGSWCGKEVMLVDDACQAGLSHFEGKRTGARDGAVGVFSFGRGKAFCGLGGGAVCVDGSLPLENAHRAELSWLQHIRESLILFLSWFLERPSLYWIPAYCPFLGLGQTKCELDFPLRPISMLQKLAAIAQLQNSAERGEGYVATAKKWSEVLCGLDVHQPFLERGYCFDGSIVPLRYPIIFSGEEKRDKAYQQLAAEGLGASKSYPRVLQDYSELSEYIIPRETPGARLLAQRIITLPVHRWVRDQDIERASMILRKIAGG